MKWPLVLVAAAIGVAALVVGARVVGAEEIIRQAPTGTPHLCPTGEIRSTGFASFIVGYGVHLGNLRGPVIACTDSGYCIDTPKGVACRKW